MWISRGLRPHCRLTLRRCGAIRFNRNMTHNVTVQKIGAAAPPGAAASRQVPMPPRRASPDAWRRSAAQVSRLDSDAASHRMRARKPMTMPRVVCPSPVSSVDGNQSIGTLTHAGCRNTVVFSSASGEREPACSRRWSHGAWPSASCSAHWSTAISRPEASTCCWASKTSRACDFKQSIYHSGKRKVRR